MPIVAYHGTGSPDCIMREGLDPGHERSWGETEEALESHGGVYCAADPGRTVSYALRAADEFCGAPAVVALSVDEADMAADEDVLHAYMIRRIDLVGDDDVPGVARDFNAGRRPTPGQVETARAWIGAFSRRFSGDTWDDGDDREVQAAYVGATDALCAAFPHLATAAFCREVWRPHTFRIRKPVGFGGDGTRIVAVADIETENLGLVLTGIPCRHGDIGDDVRDAIADAWEEELRSGNLDPTVAMRAAPAP